LENIKERDRLEDLDVEGSDGAFGFVKREGFID
jgi:hypothetical protein